MRTPNLPARFAANPKPLAQPDHHARRSRASTGRPQLAIPPTLAPEIRWQRLKALRPFATNARTHSPKQIALLAAAIGEFGFTNPILVDEANTILAGHGRIEAAKQLGLVEVPTACLGNLSPAQKHAYVLADNRLAELAGWDKETLRFELKHLIAIDFNVELTGFATGEIDLLIEGAPATDEPDPADALPTLDRNAPAITRIGDLWLLGPHRLLCADARQAESYTTLLAGEQAQMVFADPPYNVPIAGHAGGSGKIRHREFVMASGEMSREEFTAFLATVFGHLATHSMDGSIHYHCMDWRHLSEILAAGRTTYSELKNVIVWVKNNGGMGSFYRSQHELILAFKNGTAAHVNNFGLGESGRYRTNVWSYPGVNTLRPGRMDELAMHPTTKPTALVADAIRDCSKRNGLVLDPFLGSGTTILAVERTGRRAAGLELDPKYVDVAIKRWEEFTGEPAVQAQTQQTFAEIAQARSGLTPAAEDADDDDAI